MLLCLFVLMFKQQLTPSLQVAEFLPLATCRIRAVTFKKAQRVVVGRKPLHHETSMSGSMTHRVQDLLCLTIILPGGSSEPLHATVLGRGRVGKAL